MANNQDPMLERHKALNKAFVRVKRIQREAEARIVTRPAAPLTTDPDKVFDDGPGLTPDERRQHYFSVRDDPLRVEAMIAQEIDRYPKMPKHLIPRSLVNFFLDGEKEFGDA